MAVYRFSPVGSVSANDYFPAWKYNTQVRNNLNYLLQKPRVEVYRTNNTGIWPEDVWQSIPFGQESYDSSNGVDGDLHEPGEEGERLILNRVGVWLVEGLVTWDDADAALHQVRIVKNGVDVQAQADASGISGVENPLVVLAIVRATSVTDFVELRARTRFDGKRIQGGVEDTAFRATWLGADPGGVTTWTAPTTAATGTFTSARFNTQVKANLEHLYGRPSVCAFENADQTISTGTGWTTLGFNSEDWDTESLHSTVSNDSRITLARVGVWLVIGTVVFDSGAAGGDFGARIMENGTTLHGTVIRDLEPQAYAAGNAWPPTAHVAAVVYTSTTTDYVTLDVFQTSGSNLDVLCGSPELTSFRAVWLGG